MSFHIVIPARYASSRLPGKPLADINGKPMIQHVYERAKLTTADQVVVATDDQRIAEVVEGFGGEVCMTSADHQSGTERIAEVVTKYAWADDEIVVNVQGDEPDLPIELIHQVAEDMQAFPDANISTLCSRITESEMMFDPNVVKVVMDAQGFALYFSRAAIPWDRDEFRHNDLLLNDYCFRHIGLYAYRAGYIQTYVGSTVSPLEKIESLEQLRVLWHGGKIHVSQAKVLPGVGVDTKEDLKRIRNRWA